MGCCYVHSWGPLQCDHCHVHNPGMDGESGMCTLIVCHLLIACQDKSSPFNHLKEQFYDTEQMMCHTRHRRGSGCGKAQSDTRAELAYDSVEASTYVICALTPPPP